MYSAQSNQAAVGLTTIQLAQQLHLEPATLRKRYSQEGHYFGVRPRKLRNGRLIWPFDSCERLMGAKE